MKIKDPGFGIRSIIKGLMFQGLPNGEGRLAMEEYRKRIRKLMVAVNVMDGLYMQVSKKNRDERECADPSLRLG